MFKCFTRTWWKNNPEWPNGLEPSLGRKYGRGTFATLEEARAFCKEWNATNPRGRLSKRCEFEDA